MRHSFADRRALAMPSCRMRRGSIGQRAAGSLARTFRAITALGEKLTAAWGCSGPPFQHCTGPRVKQMSGMEPMYRELWQDVRYAARVFPKQPVFAAAAVLTLALGIGAPSATFSVVHGVLLKPLPFFEPERPVSVAQIAPHGAGANGIDWMVLLFKASSPCCAGASGGPMSCS